MKNRATKVFGLLALMGLGCGVLLADDRGASQARSTRIGVYDSRAVAYAWFWSKPVQQQMNEQFAAAKKAKEVGDTAKYNEYITAIRARQDQSHREVFSTAPASEALTVIKARIPEIEEQAGVTALVSKWDDKTLKQYPNAVRVDVTDRLVHEFIQPNEKQARTLAGMVTSRPLSLKECDELIRKGEL